MSIPGIIIGGLILYFIKKKIEARSNYKFTLEKFREKENYLIRIQNQGYAIEGCTILCGKIECNWWDTNKPNPRHINPGSGGNVFLPRISEYSNPTIRVKKYNKTLKKIRLDKIVETKQ